MPESLILADRRIPVKTTRLFGDFTVPWELSDYRSDALAFEGSGFFDMSHWGTVLIEGPDARDYLNRMTTVAFKSVAPGQFYHGAFLTGRGTVVTLGLFRQMADKENRFQYVLPVSQGALAAEHIEKFHFAEVLTVVDESAGYQHFGLSLEAAGKVFGEVSKTPLKIGRHEWEGTIVEGWRHDSIPVWIVQCRKADAPVVLSALLKIAKPVGLRVWNFLRLSNGVPESGNELTEKEIILEGNYDRAVARNKGCYPGQEVVERIYTYGQVNKKLLPVHWKGEVGGVHGPIDLLVEGKKVGELISFDEDPKKPKEGRGLAFVHKAHWEAKELSTSQPGLFVTL